MATIELQNIVKRYGKAATTVQGIDLSVADGEFVVLVGPSGCGKSTTLRMIAGLEDITSGTLRIGGRVVNELEPKERNIAMVFQNYAIYPHMNVGQNIGFGLHASGLDKDAKQKRIRETAALLGLEPLLDRRPAQLSGGQRQRVAIGRAMVRDPAAFLFDEPLSNLDAQLRAQMRLEIKRLHQRLGTTTVFVTHDQVEAMTMADRIVVMRDGRILQVGTPLDLYERPVDIFTARFIGSPTINLLPGRLTHHGDGLAVELDGGGPRVPVLQAVQAAAKDAAVLVGWRPHDLVMDDGSAAAADAVLLTGEVAVVEPLGSETLVHIDSGVSQIVASTGGKAIPKVGERITVRAPLQSLYLFDTATERALVSR
jgi:multiple sugar transport system ATP-binding protein